jgi:DNA mismatch repair protein MutS
LRRTLVNGDRYTTEKLSELEDELLSSGQKIIDMEKQLFIAVRSGLKKYTRFFQSAAKECAYIDVTACYAHTAVMRKWEMPLVDQSASFTIEGGRHPVVEKHLPSGEFVPNDTALEDGKTFALVTGPNMAGKSTYLRQNALIALLAQTGSFVPASKAHIGVVDRVFCRVGASDNLARGESTFLVEMTETAHILRHATEHSLVIMDEVGRGTSTEDGLSIAWAVCEYLLESVRCKTFFATHYHELTRLLHPRLLFLCMDVRENGDQIVFLKKIKHGSAESSYGIHAARLAGVPAPVLERAEAILNALRHQAGEKTLGAIPSSEQMPRRDSKNEPSLFSDEELILDEILSCNPDSITPIEALTLLSRWKKSLAGR